MKEKISNTIKSLKSIEGNTQRLDGGSMFGNAPKALWKRWLTPNEENRIPLACRSLLVQTENSKNFLFDVGVGAFFDPKMKARYGVMESEHLLLKNLQEVGISEEDIDGIILSHLHFDHAGGLLSAFDEKEGNENQKTKEPHLLFPNATYYVGKEHWERAQNPHPRERASFLPHLHQLLKDSGRLVLLDSQQESSLPFKVSFSFVHGHTIGSMLSEIDYNGRPLVFVADLIPGMPWMHVPITMGYDRFPELLVNEKKEFLEKMLKEEGSVFFTHDPNISFAKVKQDEKGKFYGEPFSL